MSNKGFDSWFSKHWRVFWSCWFQTTRLKIAWEKVCFFSYPVTCVDHRGPFWSPASEMTVPHLGDEMKGVTVRKEVPGPALLLRVGGIAWLSSIFPFSIELVSQDLGKGDIVFFAEKCFLTPIASQSSIRGMYLGNTVQILRWVKEPLPCVFVNKHFPSVQDAYEKNNSLLCIRAFNFVKHIHMCSEALCFPPF